MAETSFINAVHVHIDHVAIHVIKSQYLHNCTYNWDELSPCYFARSMNTLCMPLRCIFSYFSMQFLLAQSCPLEVILALVIYCVVKYNITDTYCELDWNSY